MDKLDNTSLDIVESNISKLKELFPDIITEDKIDIDKLKNLLGEYAESNKERYSFSWNGKLSAIRNAQTPSSGTLRPLSDLEGSELKENIFIEGDNLEVLKILQKSYHKKIKMIFIDPPYNTGKEFIYPDKFQDNLKTYLELSNQVDGMGMRTSTNSETNGRYHTNWLNMMYPRLKLARNLLSNDGSIFIAIDDSEYANLKKMCDEIFGEENLVASIVWQHSLQPKGYSHIFSQHHNYILCYKKSDDFQLSALARTDEDNKNYSNPDNDPKGPWRTGDVRNALYRPNLIYNITTPSGKTINPPENGWRWSEETLKEKISTGEIYFSDDETRIIRKIYLANQDGRAPETIWFGKNVGTTRDGAKELKGLFDGKAPFDTVKPMGLVKQMLQIAGVEDGDICLDFFAGSGTTACACLEYDKDVKFICVQLPEVLQDKTPHGKVALSLGLNTISDVSIERINRFIKSIESDQSMLIFKLDSSNIKEWDIDEENLEGTLFEYVTNIKEDRNDSDLLYEIILKYGLSLTLPIDKKDISGTPVYCLGLGSLIICLEDKITLDLIEGIAALKQELNPYSSRVVFKDNSFGDDNVKTNTIQILKQCGVGEIKTI